VMTVFVRLVSVVILSIDSRHYPHRVFSKDHAKAGMAVVRLTY
jgi:hypothetical protein